MLIKKAEGFGKFIAIAGFRDVTIRNINNFLDFNQKKDSETIQFFDADLIAGPEHLFFAAINALNTFRRKINISKTMTIETLLFASAQRQIKKAINILGIKSTSSRLAVLIIDKKQQNISKTLEFLSDLIPGQRDDRVLELNDEKFGRIKKMFDISDLELSSKLRKIGLERDALIDLVFEHIALLVIR
jgi:KEOPS complex subunit Cgi121